VLTAHPDLETRHSPGFFRDDPRQSLYEAARAFYIAAEAHAWGYPELRASKETRLQWLSRLQRDVMLALNRADRSEAWLWPRKPLGSRESELWTRLIGAHLGAQGAGRSRPAWPLLARAIREAFGPDFVTAAYRDQRRAEVMRSHQWALLSQALSLEPNPTQSETSPEQTEAGL
jgi:hypothetical protein